MIDTIDHGPVRELRLARPPANALDPALLAALRDALTAAPDQGARAVVLSGQPGIFSGGLDVPYLITLDRERLAAELQSFFDVMAALAGAPIPVAAGITGHSPAGGAVLALFCDHRIMADGELVIGLNEVRVGIPLPSVIAFALERLVGARKAEQMGASGALIGPGEALQVGFVDEVVPADEVVAAAVAWCEGMLQLPERALRLTRRVLRQGLVDAVQRSRSRDMESLVEEWFQPENQQALRELVRRLA